PSLLPGLLTSITHNINHRTPDISLFEIGRVFVPAADGKYTEQLKLAIAITGSRHTPFWSGAERDAKYDIFDMKGILEDFADRIGLRGISFVRAEEPSDLFVEWGKICQGKMELARFGQVFPPLARKMDMRDPVFLAEWNMEILLARRNPNHSFKALGDFPSSRRDVAMLVDEEITHENVLSAVKRAKAGCLDSVELFDIFKGKGIPEGKKSMAYAFTYRSNERTLTDNEVNTAHQKVLDSLQQNLKAVLR
ncbi:MAG: phenylalanine--tRNA ligase subunit beta, partial [Verrucomicrobia bacterium]|nr:phenylalanine--tRNA ligase subunit beta [Verrucomicrobiota bacterium]